MGRPKPPDPMQTAEVQQGFNRDALRDALAASQIGQDTPWGSIDYSGEIGSPDRRQQLTLNPQDQQRLDQQRGIQSGLLSLITGQGKSGQAQPMPPMQQPPMPMQQPPMQAPHPMQGRPDPGVSQFPVVNDRMTDWGR